MLQDALRDARENKVQSMAIAYTKKNGDAYTDYVLDKGSSIPELIGGIERVKARVVKMWLEE